MTEKSTNVDLDTANSYIVKTDIVPEETVKVVYQAHVAKSAGRKSRRWRIGRNGRKGAFY